MYEKEKQRRGAIFLYSHSTLHNVDIEALKAYFEDFILSILQCRKQAFSYMILNLQSWKPCTIDILEPSTNI